jgi:alginate production protein
MRILWCWLAVSLAAWSAPSALLQSLTANQRAKLECRLLPGKRLVARKVEIIGQDDGFALEGLAQKVNRPAGTFELGPFTIRLSEKTRFENSRREPADPALLANGRRVKVKARELEGRRVKARTIRFYEESLDTDLEIEAPIERIDARNSVISVLSLAVKVSLKVPDESAEDGGAGQYIRRDDDAQHPDPKRLGPLYLGGNASFTHDRTRNLDLNARAPDSDDWLTPNIELETSLPLGEFSEFYAKMNFNERFYHGNDPLEHRQKDFNVREAYLFLGNFLHPSLGLQIGRQRFRDKREWLYDDQLDAVRLHFARANLKVEVSAAKGLAGPTGSRSDQYHLIGYAQYRFPGRRYLSGYLLKRNDLTPRDEDPLWYGLSSRGPLIRNLEYWMEASRMKGRRGQSLLRGYAWDAGLSYRLPLRWQPTLSAGYAFGSGDNNLNDGVDGNFRQTSLNDNTYRYNGLKRFYYYGLLFRPELYNLRTPGVDLGIRPSEQWSVNISYHGYRQAVPYRRLGESELTIRPSGRDARLGKEFDLVLAIRKLPNTDLNFYAGLFLPGRGFSGAPPRGFFFRQEVRFYF